jgi:hypothetical protein
MSASSQFKTGSALEEGRLPTPTGQLFLPFPLKKIYTYFNHYKQNLIILRNEK